MEQEQDSKDYAAMLELAYGQGMMSEGGVAAFEAMFAGISLQGKSGLEIGFGLGGLAFYLANHYQCSIHGLEVSPWMVERARALVPAHLNDQLNFSHYQPPMIDAKTQAIARAY